MNYILIMLLSCCVYLSGLAQEEDIVVLSDGERVFGTIIEDTPLLVIVRKKSGEIFKFPQRIVERKRYTDTTNWGSIAQHMRNDAYMLVYNKLYKDMRSLKNGGSLRQVKTMVYCLRQLGHDEQLVNLCHEVSRFERQDIIQVLDLFISIDDSSQFAQREKLWLKTIKYSKYKRARKRCAMALACIYAVNSQLDKVKDLRVRQELDEEEALQGFLHLIDQCLSNKKAQRQLMVKDPQFQMTHFFQSLRIQNFIEQGHYDQAALQALQIGLDPDVDHLKRLGFLNLAQRALRAVAMNDAQTVGGIISRMKKELNYKE